MRHAVLRGNFDVVQEDRSGLGGSERILAGNGWRGDAFPLSLENEALDFHVVRLRSSPDDKSVGDRAVRDPSLAAVEDVSVRGLVVLGDGLHSVRVRTVVRLSQAEAADFLACCQVWNVLLLLLLRSVGANRPHDQR